MRWTLVFFLRRRTWCCCCTASRRRSSRAAGIKQRLSSGEWARAVAETQVEQQSFFHQAGVVSPVSAYSSTHGQGKTRDGLHTQEQF